MFRVLCQSTYTNTLGRGFPIKKVISCLFSRDQSAGGVEVEEKSLQENRRKSLPVMRYRNRLTAIAPLASQETINSSLRSSFSSLYFESPINSIRSSLLESGTIPDDEEVSSVSAN